MYAKLIKQRAVGHRLKIDVPSSLLDVHIFYSLASQVLQVYVIEHSYEIIVLVKRLWRHIRTDSFRFFRLDVESLSSHPSPRDLVNLQLLIFAD